MEAVDRARQRPRLSMRLLRVGLLFPVLVLAGGYLTTRLLVARAESAYPRSGELIEVAGLAQHVVGRGAGQPVVLVHGAFGAAQDFVATIIDELASRYRCVAWDRPGHGYSERPEGVVDPGVQAELLLALIRRLGLERPLLVGFSYGGAVALAAALRDPDAVRGVVLLNSPSHPWPDPLDFHYALPVVPVIGALSVETLVMPLGRLMTASSIERAFSPHPVPAAFGGSPIPLSLRPASYRANAEDMRTLKPFLRAQSEHYGELAVPITMVVSEDDLVVDPTLHSPALEAAAPRISVTRIPGAGHQILYTHPRVAIDAIDSAMGKD